VLIEVFALELQNVSDQQLSILTGHSDEAPMEAVGVERIGNRIYPQHFEGGLKEHLPGKEQGAGENLMRLVGLTDYQANPSSTQIDRLFYALALGAVCLGLKADGQCNGNAIKISSLSRRWWSRGI
jgi:hypothetical protein